jgi:hypothetical protein
MVKTALSSGAVVFCASFRAVLDSNVNPFEVSKKGRFGELQDGDITQMIGAYPQ